MPKQTIELTGQRFGRLMVEARDNLGSDRHGIKWRCKCDCGNAYSTYGYHLSQGRVQSCGCLRREHCIALGSQNVKHGMYRTPEHMSWGSMKTRCNNSNHMAFDRYGGRGIKVCDSWLNSFETFFFDMGPRPSPLHSIERHDNNGNYEPGNCYWATPSEQSNNTSANINYQYGDRRFTRTQLAREFGISPTGMKKRLEKSPTLGGLVKRI